MQCAPNVPETESEGVHTMFNRTIITASTVLVTTLASADIGFPTAIETTRGANPADYTLLDIELRERNGNLNYESDSFSSDAVMEFEVRIDPETGVIIQTSLETADPNDQSDAAAVLARWDEVLIDFTDALDSVAGVDPEAAPFKLQLHIEDGIVVYQIEAVNANSQEVKYYVNAGNGVIHDNNDGEDNETASNESFTMAIAIASKATGATPLEAEAENEGATDHIEVMLYDEATSSIIEMDVAVSTGEILSTQTYEPGPSQLERILEILAVLPKATVSFGDALMVAADAYPGSATHEIELRYEDAGLRYEVELILDMMEVEVHVDAGTGGAAAANSTMPLFGDFNLDGTVGINDLLEIITLWNSINPAYDLDNSGTVGVGDLLVMIENWG